MSFTDGQPFIVTEEQSKLSWNGNKNGESFRCFLCGVKFKCGDLVRWVFTNHKDSGCPGNPFVCSACDGSDVKERLKNHYKEGFKRFWWLFQHGKACGSQQ